MFGRLLSVSGGQRGITALEVLIAAGIAGIIGSGVVMGIGQTLNTSIRNGDHILATKELRNAEYWIRHDARMAQSVQVDTGDSGLPLVLSWVEWSNSQHAVTYDIDGVSGGLMRSHSINGETPAVLQVAANVNPDPTLTNCEFTNGTLSFEVTISMGEGSRLMSESQQFKVNPRPG